MTTSDGLSIVRFLAGPSVDLDDVIEIVPAIDGAKLTDLVHGFELHAGLEKRSASYGGLIPANYSFGRLDRHYLGLSSLANKTPVLGCSCGEWGCWPLLVRIVATEDLVSWSDFEQPFRSQRDYSGFGPFRFARNRYEEALAELQSAVGGIWQ